MTDYPRDMIGYGPIPPQANWPNGAKLAVQFVINYEEGGENNILHGTPPRKLFSPRLSPLNPGRVSAI